MKKFSALIALILSLFMLFSCANNTKNQDKTSCSESVSANIDVTSHSENTVSTAKETFATSPSPEICRHRYKSEVITPADEENDGIIKYTCSKCGDSYTEKIPKVKPIKILAVGNSFSDDALSYLYYMYEEAGYNDIAIANLYIGSCSLDTHWQKIQSNEEAYLYRKTTNGIWYDRKNTSFSYGIEDEDWDFIIVQQKGNDAGNPSSMKNLPNIVEHIRDEKPNAKIYWHMTWAYRNTDDLFPGRYGDNQLDMYNRIASATENQILSLAKFDGLLPCGTAIQNLRSADIEDYKFTLNDGFHLSSDFGRYTASLTLFCSFTGLSPEEINFIPAVSYSELSGFITEIRASVKNAINNPFKITPCD